MRDYLIVSDIDNVGIAISDLKEGTIYKDILLTLSEDIKKGHKFALRDIKKGEDIIKYHMPIGHAKEDIKKGSWVHTHNIVTNLDDTLEYEYDKKEINNIRDDEEYYFNGYLREDGSVGIRNDIWIVPAVGCINKICSNIAKLAEKKYRDIKFTSLEHDKGCSQLGDDLESTQKILAGLIKNPNAAGVLVVALGCENNQLEDFKKFLEPVNDKRIKFIRVQDYSDEIEEAMKLIDELVDYRNSFKREKLSISNLKVGFKCGGSDGFSGITANPLCGYVSDTIVSHGGITMITEVPEMFGAETLLMNRAKNEIVFNDIVKLVNDFKKYFKSYGQTVYENPSPGNKEGGITTLEDKSLGCIQKGGRAEITGVLNFGEYPKERGFHLLNGPGNDQVSSTNLAASGCNIIVFTTGRGNPFGSVIPTVKLSSNTDLYNKKNNWIDFDAGVVLEEGRSFKDLNKDFINYLLKVASGEETKNEKNGFEEIVIFKNGVIL